MISGGRRYCDTCNVPILELESYYTALLPTSEINRMLEAGPAQAPTYTPLPDGSNRLELCEHCVQRSPALAELMKRIDPPRDAAALRAIIFRS